MEAESEGCPAVNQATGSMGGGVEGCGVASSDLRSMEPGARRRFLVAQTARFSASFLRWAESNQRHGLSFPRLRVIEALHGRGPAIMRQLADQLGMTARNMTAVVDALEDGGLVTRRPHPSDRRATLVELTGPGEDAAAGALEGDLEAMAAVFDGLSIDEQETYLALIVGIFEAMGSAADRGAC